MFVVTEAQQGYHDAAGLYHPYDPTNVTGGQLAGLGGCGCAVRPAGVGALDLSTPSGKAGLLIGGVLVLAVGAAVYQTAKSARMFRDVGRAVRRKRR